MGRVLERMSKNTNTSTVAGATRKAATNATESAQTPKSGFAIHPNTVQRIRAYPAKK